jgi:uncharacterized membrane protein
MAHWAMYALFSVGVVIELVSVYLDWRVMTGKGKTSGAWGVAFVIFVLFGLYGALLGNRRDEPFVFTRELAVALAAIGFQYSVPRAVSVGAYLLAEARLLNLLVGNTGSR